MPLPVKDRDTELKIKKAQTVFADDEKIAKLNLADMPKEATSSEITKGRTIGRGMPTAKVDTGDVPMQTSKIQPSTQLTAGLNTMLQGIESTEEDTTDGAEKPVPEVETLPTILQNALSTEAGEINSYRMDNVVKSNPRAAALKVMGREIFTQLSETPKTLKDIYVISDLTNTPLETQTMAAWILMHGRKIRDLQYTFNDLPGYHPKAELWEDNGARFLLVRETKADLQGADVSNIRSPKDLENAMKTAHLEDSAGGESIEDSFDDPDFEEKVNSKECVYYIYGWDEPTSAISGDVVTNADLLEAATQMARNRIGMTVKEAYTELLAEYMYEDVIRTVNGDLEETPGDVSTFPPPRPRMGEGIEDETENDRGDVSRFKKPSLKQYVAKWQEYDRGPAPCITINFKARSDEDALRRIFLKKVVEDEGNSSIEEWCAEWEMDPAEVTTAAWLTKYFDEIDTSGWPYLVNLTNKTTGETVYDCGFDDSGDDEDWDDEDE